MPQALIILGLLLALAGIGSIAAGAPSWILGLGLGTALIQSGAVGLVGGFLLIGIGFVLRALRDLSRQVETMAAVASVAPRSAAPAPLSAPAPAPRASAKREVAPPVPPRREPPAFAGREELKDSSLLGRDSDEDFPEPEERARPPRPRLPEPETRTPPRPAFAPPERSRERPRPSFDRPAPPPPAYEDEYEDEALPAPPARNSGAPTIVRSGIIGGMAYTLYTDGSIEAELPIGTVRFASIEELQDHVSQTGDDADVDFGAPPPSRN